MLPSRNCRGDLLDWNKWRYLGNDGIDRVRALHLSAARRLAAFDRRGELELKHLRVVQRNVGYGITGGSNLVACQADDRELVAARTERDLVAETETSQAVRNHLVMAAHDPAPGDQFLRTTRPAQLEADHKETQRDTPELCLNRLVGDSAHCQRRPVMAVEQKKYALRESFFYFDP